MECHDVQQLLAFVNRKCEDLDAVEQGAIREHLDRCPDCATRARAERRADETLGRLMREVPVPAGLKPQVLKRLKAQRNAARGQTMKRGALAAAVAAAVLIAVAAGFAWHARWPVEVAPADVSSVLAQVHRNGFWDEDSVKQYLRENGLPDKVPPQAEFDYRNLENVEPFVIQGRRVAKLTFVKGNDIAVVLVLPWEQFRTNNLAEDPTCLKIVVARGEGVIYLILFRGNLGELQPPPRQAA